MTSSTDYNLFCEIINQLIDGHEIDGGKFFQATDLLRGIARDCAEQAERLAVENEELLRKNNTLAWLAMAQARIITGRIQEHRA